MKEKQILLVDDDENFLRLITILLQSHDYEVSEAHTGEEALKKANHKPDLIILDRQLPDGDGLEICRKIREDTKLRSIPIIILSARDRSDDKVEGLYIGADDYVTKPFNNEELIARIETVLRRNFFFEQAQGEKNKVIAELKRILDHELVTPFYQPIFSLKDSKIIGFEILTRPPADSSLSNPEFLFKAAIAFGMYFELEMLAWNKAISRWRMSGRKEKLFLNCNPYLIENEQFDQSVIKRHGIHPSSIVLEITERKAIHDYNLFFQRIQEVRELGLLLAIDDVGSGYASLDTIAQVKPDVVKIDIALVKNIDSDPLKQNIVIAIRDFAQRSDIMTIAEGVERKEELEKLKEFGIDCAQGYFLGKPSPEIPNASHNK